MACGAAFISAAATRRPCQAVISKTHDRPLDAAFAAGFSICATPPVPIGRSIASHRHRQTHGLHLARGTLHFEARSGSWNMKGRDAAPVRRRQRTATRSICAFIDQRRLRLDQAAAKGSRRPRACLRPNTAGELLCDLRFPPVSRTSGSIDCPPRCRRFVRAVELPPGRRRSRACTGWHWRPRLSLRWLTEAGLDRFATRLRARLQPPLRPSDTAPAQPGAAGLGVDGGAGWLRRHGLLDAMDSTAQRTGLKLIGTR